MGGQSRIGLVLTLFDIPINLVKGTGTRGRLQDDIQGVSKVRSDFFFA